MVVTLYNFNTQFIKSYVKFKKSSIDVNDDFMKSYIKSNCSLDEFISFVKPTFYNSKDRDKFHRERCNIIKIPKKYLGIWNKYKIIEQQPQPEQKTKEWYKMREEKITASSGADAINESKYNSLLDLLESKLGIGKPFKENYHVHHGKKLENIATLIYEYINNVKVGEFGLVPHMSTPHVSFLSASPDGICTCSTLDGKFSPLVGRMLEIKCVTTRQLNTKGPEHMIVTKEQEDLGIVPHVYWVQMQLQLECCDLEECDFWQCKIKNYWSVKTLLEAVKEHGPSHHTIGNNNEERYIDPRLEVGALIELLPIDESIVPEGEKIEWYGKYIYPPDLLLDLKQKTEWAINMKATWQTHYPNLAKEYRFGKILYYHLEQSHCYLVKRDREWFKSKLPKFKEFWDKVEYYRANPDKLYEIEEEKKKEKLKKKKEKEKKMMKMFDSDED